MQQHQPNLPQMLWLSEGFAALTTLKWPVFRMHSEVLSEVVLARKWKVCYFSDNKQLELTDAILNNYF